MEFLIHLFMPSLKFLDAVNSCTALSIKSPTTTNKEKQTAMNGFLEKSEQKLFRGCIGAIDRYLQPISKPRKKDCDGFPQAAILVWALYVIWIECSSFLEQQLLFPILWCRDTRKMSRSEGIWKKKNVFRLYPTFVQDNSYIADDAVYTLTDQVLCPILGSQRESTNKDAYN